MRVKQHQIDLQQHKKKEVRILNDYVFEVIGVIQVDLIHSLSFSSIVF